MKNFMLLGSEKTKPINWFIVRGSWFIAKIKKGSLKKQSQFYNGQNSVKSILTMVYRDIISAKR